MNRERLLESVEERPFDLIVIGAGIARDAAMRG